MTKKGSSLSTHRAFLPVLPDEIAKHALLLGESMSEQGSYDKALLSLKSLGTKPSSIFLLDDYLGHSFPGIRTTFSESSITSFNPSLNDFSSKNELIACALADAFDIRMLGGKDMTFYNIQQTRIKFGNPDMIVCRSPRVIESVGRDFQTYNLEVIEALKNWAMFMIQNGKPMLMTFLVEDEAKRVMQVTEGSGLEMFYYNNTATTPLGLVYQRPTELKLAMLDKIIISNMPLDLA